MEAVQWGIIMLLLIIIMVLVVKISLLRASVRRISETISEQIETDTNTLIDLPTRDKRARKLADEINRSLRLLRKERHRFEQGDCELRNAMTNISHDLRTPLTAISGYLELLEQESKSKECARYLNIISERIEIMKSLTEELFRYSVIMSKEPESETEPVSLNRILEESLVAFYQTLIEKQIVPDVHMPDQQVYAQLHSASLSRVFSNLLTNAIKYSDGDLCVVLTADGEITFSNSAATLSEVQVGQLFDRFYTVEAARKSTGLGLSIAKTLIEQMKGTIKAGYDTNRLSIIIRLPVLYVTSH